MQTARPTHHLLHIALLFLVLVGLGHVHNHVCLDGQEPPSLVHFENLGGHPAHHDDAVHVDVENELMPQLLHGKASDQDVPVFLLSFSLLLLIRRPQHQRWLVIHATAPYHPPPVALPPSRGPPSIA